MKKIVCTAAGRKENLEILSLYLNKYKDEFDSWEIWVNTNVSEDIEYMKELEENYSWASLIYSQDAVDYSNFEKMRANISLFFANCNDPNAVYLRTDDDIIFIEQNAISKMFNARIQDTSTPIILGNIVNNAVISKIYQDSGIFSWPEDLSYHCLDKTAWENPEFAKNLHIDFINKINNNEVQSLYFENQEVKDFTRISINAFTLRGDMIDLIKDDIILPVTILGTGFGVDEEEFLTTALPKKLNIPNKIIGNAVFGHYSFFIQRDELDKNGILKQYKKIALRIAED
jgi:hypothetical protein